MPHASLSDLLRARRIAVRGVTGAGKSTAARELAAVLGAPVIDYDDILWEHAAVVPWLQRDSAAQRDLTRRRIAESAWVMASVGPAVRDLVETRLDLVIYLDYPPLVSLTRLLRRTACRCANGAKVCNGNRETLGRALGRDSSILWWARTVGPRHRSARELADAPDGAPVLVLTDPRQWDRVLEAVRAQRGAAAYGAASRPVPCSAVGTGAGRPPRAPPAQSTPVGAPRLAPEAS